MGGLQWESAMTDHAALQLEHAGWGPKYLAFLENLCVEGTAIQKVPYRYLEKERLRRMQKQDPLSGEIYSTRELGIQVCYDGPDIENIALEDFYPDWTVKTPGEIQMMRGCAHRVRKNLSELKELRKIKRPDGQEVGTYINLDEVEKSINSKGNKAWEKPYYSEPGQWKNDPDELKKPVELWEYWGLFDESGKGDFKEYIIVVANGDVVIRLQKNFYDYKIKPFVATPNIVRGHHWYGLSELFALRGHILEASRLRNGRLDSVNMAINPMWLMERSSGANPNALYMRSNGIVMVNNIRGIQRLPPPEVPPSAFAEVQELGSEMQSVSGTLGGPNISQAGKAFGRSASGANLVSNIASARANLKLIVLSQLYFKPMAEIFMQTNSQFITENQSVRNSDPDALTAYSQIPPEAFQQGYAYEPISAVLASPENDSQKMQTGLPFLQAAETAQPGVINWDAFFRDAGRALFGRQVTKFIRSPEEVAQMQAMKVASEQAVNAQQGAAAPQPNETISNAPPEGLY
jgi:hypothetical protein